MCVPGVACFASASAGPRSSPCTTLELLSCLLSLRVTSLHFECEPNFALSAAAVYLALLRLAILCYWDSGILVVPGQGSAKVPALHQFARRAAIISPKYSGSSLVSLSRRTFISVVTRLETTCTAWKSTSVGALDACDDKGARGNIPVITRSLPGTNHSVGSSTLIIQALSMRSCRSGSLMAKGWAGCTTVSSRKTIRYHRLLTQPVPFCAGDVAIDVEGIFTRDAEEDCCLRGFCPQRFSGASH